jgi:hypothetical protein
VGAAGVGIFFIASSFDSAPVHLYAVYDYWHTSPNFFLARVAILLMLTFFGYVWCRWGPVQWMSQVMGRWSFSPLIQLGQTSLLVYWVHIDFVYGSLSLLPKRAESLPMASVGLLIIFVVMVLLSIARTSYRGRNAELLSAHRPVVNELPGN